MFDKQKGTSPNKILLLESFFTFSPIFNNISEQNYLDKPVFNNVDRLNHFLRWTILLQIKSNTSSIIRFRPINTFKTKLTVLFFSIINHKHQTRYIRLRVIHLWFPPRKSILWPSTPRSPHPYPQKWTIQLSFKK